MSTYFSSRETVHVIDSGHPIIHCYVIYETRTLSLADFHIPNSQEVEIWQLFATCSNETSNVIVLITVVVTIVLFLFMFHYYGKRYGKIVHASALWKRLSLNELTVLGNKYEVWEWGNVSYFLV